MRRYNFLIFGLFFLLSTSTWSLTTVSTGTYSVKEGDSIEIAVSVASPNLSSLVLQVYYDSQLLEYHDTLNRIRGTIPSSRAKSESLIQVGVSTNPPGILTFPFFNPEDNGVNRGNGVLFSFTMKGRRSGVSSLTYKIIAKTSPDYFDETSFTTGAVTITEIKNNPPHSLNPAGSADSESPTAIPQNSR